MKRIVPGLFLALAVGAAVLVFDVVAQTCDTQSGTAVGYRGGDASTLNELNGVSNDVTNMYLRLKGKGANFVPSSNYNVTTNKRMTGASADFNNDGKWDLVEGGRQCDYNTNPALGNLITTDSNLSVFVGRGHEVSDPNKFKFDGPFYILYEGTAMDRTYEIMALGAGDFDKDGDADIAALTWQGRLFIIPNLFIENGLAPGDLPVFSGTMQYLGDLINDGYTEWGQGSSNWRWESNIAVVDFDNDGDLDLLVGVPSRWAGYRYGEVVRFVNNGSGTFSRLTGVINPYSHTNSTYIYGVCGVAAGDFDGDAKVDFMCGSANSRDILFYQGDGLGGFTAKSNRKITIPASHGTCSMLGSADFDEDGKVDFVLSTDGAAGVNTPGGFAYWFKSLGTGSFTQNCIPSNCTAVSTSGDFDSGAVGDFDGDGDFDFFVADGNNSLSCYFFVNEIFPLYVSSGTVTSKNLVPCAFLTSDSAIVSATIHVTDSKPAGTTITYYLANSDDASGNPLWEGPVTPDVEFTFSSPGLFLRWKAALTTSDETQTPRVLTVDLDYKYITKREYSRTSHAFTSVDLNTSREGDENVLYSASFEFPSWDGHLRAWDVTSLTLEYTRNTQLANITSVGATLVGDAGELLAARNYTSRTVYTAYDEESDGVMNNRLDFNVTNKATLENYLNLGTGSTETEPLIEFVLGNGRTWKLGDINHSSPQVEERPSGVPSLMGAGYDLFRDANTARRKVLLVGANDGMLHCFDPITLEELWAFIPHNLLYKLKTMRIRDPECGEFLSHQYFVDGTPVIQDVYFGGNWHTIVVCGQGAGWGKDHQFYYFCLDITDPLNPQPLWELTDPTMGETWSVPIIGKLNISGTETWVAFMGSGYDTWDTDQVSGNVFYGVDVATGSLLKSITLKSGGTEPVSPYGIVNAAPGSANIVDYNKDGIDDYAYIGDLLGRMWRIDLTTGVNQWKADIIFTDPYYHPIITKPAIYVGADGVVFLYFGTGGDDKAPASDTYAFLALADNGSVATVQWFLGSDDLATQPGFDINKKKGEFSQGEKVWADDVIADRRVYIATLQGSIESLNPCLTLSGSGRIYSRYIQGSQAGGSALLGTNGETIESLLTAQKVRSAVTVGNIQKVTSDEGSISKRLVFIQSYTQSGTGEPPSEVLAQTVTGSKLVIKSWREVYKR